MNDSDPLPNAAGRAPVRTRPASTLASAPDGLIAEWPGRLWALALLGLVFAALLISRQPSAILHAEFWGDDGWLWYPEAYGNALASFVAPRAGYLQTIARLGALVSQPFPLAWAPTVFAIIALFMQILPPIFLVSSRMADAWPNPWARLAFALILIGLPNSYEVFMKLTDTQWQLAILTFMVTVSRPPTTRAGHIFDTAILLIGGLSGPFCLMLLPVAAWQYRETRNRTVLWRCGLLLLAACIQSLCLVLTMHTRSTAPLGASVGVFARIVGLNILLAVFLGQQRLQSVLELPVWQPHHLGPIVVTACGFALIACGLWAGNNLLRKAWLFAALSLAAALAVPQVTLTGPQWLTLIYTGWGDRYYLFPMIAFIGVLFALAGAKPLAFRLTGGLALAIVVVVGVAGDWVYPVMPPTDFLIHARAFDAAPPGTVMKLPMHPTGDDMWMKKK